MTSNLFQPRQAVVTIYGGDYLDRLRHLERQHDSLVSAIEAAKKRESGTVQTLNEVPESVELEQRRDQLAAEHVAVKAEADESAVHIKLQALPRRVFKDLVAAHPPRKVGQDGVTKEQADGDQHAGVNDDSFGDALVPASIVEPDLTEDDLAELSAADFERLYLVAFGLNRLVPADPKASLVSRPIPTSSETSD